MAGAVRQDRPWPRIRQPQRSRGGSPSDVPVAPTVHRPIGVLERSVTVTGFSRTGRNCTFSRVLPTITRASAIAGNAVTVTGLTRTTSNWRGPRSTTWNLRNRYRFA